MYSIPSRYFLHNGDPRQIELRGGPVFDMWRALGHDVHMGNELTITSPAAVLMMVPAAQDCAASMERWASYSKWVTVVDVAFPLMRPDAMQGTANSVAFWTQPEHQAAALRAVRAADAVTVPWPEWDGYPAWIDDIAEHNPNVIVLPDLRPDDEDDVGRFAASLLRIWATARKTKLARLAIRTSTDT